jgi:hypothetical protein
MVSFSFFLWRPAFQKKTFIPSFALSFLSETPAGF